MPYDLCSADCASDCRTAIESADKLIQDLKDQINLHKQLEETQQKSIADLTTQNKEKSEELSSPLRNPWIVGGIGISVGAVLVLLLQK